MKAGKPKVADLLAVEHTVASGRLTSPANENNRPNPSEINTELSGALRMALHADAWSSDNEWRNQADGFFE